MFSGPALAATLRTAHYRLKRCASDLDAAAQPYQIAERSALGPTWHYGQDTEPVRYTDGQCLTLADGRMVILELQIVFEPDCVTVNGRLHVEADEDTPSSGGPAGVLVDAGPRWARTDEQTTDAIGQTLAELTGRSALLAELGVPARAGFG
ncbi:hypothetical protein [Catenulispora subtropica]|uniref:Uncharacterized protein n=1 Tax=Catenulispora subtropica TaxID=450798 RepID=A0ABN2SYK8_9ACTN